MQRGMFNIFIIMIFGAALSVSPAWAEETDPFFPSENRPSGQVTVPSDSDWGRDPFSSPVSRKTTATREAGSGASRGNLTGIIFSKDVRIAIIGGEALREGSVVGNRKLMDIRKKSVVFMDAGGVPEEVFLEDFSLSR